MSDDTSLNGRRILLVEDEYIIAMEVKRWLQRAGAIVIGPVPSVEQALDLIEEEGLDGAVLDFNLGDKTTALPIADKLSALKVPHLFATGDVQVSRDGDAQATLLIKPFIEAELVGAVAKVIRPS